MPNPCLHKPHLTLHTPPGSAPTPALPRGQAVQSLPRNAAIASSPTPSCSPFNFSSKTAAWPVLLQCDFFTWKLSNIFPPHSVKSGVLTQAAGPESICLCSLRDPSSTALPSPTLLCHTGPQAGPQTGQVTSGTLHRRVPTWSLSPLTTAGLHLHLLQAFAHGRLPLLHVFLPGTWSPSEAPWSPPDTWSKSVILSSSFTHPAYFCLLCWIASSPEGGGGTAVCLVHCGAPGIDALYTASVKYLLNRWMTEQARLSLACPCFASNCTHLPLSPLKGKA